MAKNSAVVAMALVMMALVAMGSMVKEIEAACPEIDMDECLPAAEADVDPTTECCTALTEYLSAQGADCLCEQALATMFLASHTPDYAILIPEKCNLTFEVGFECGGKSDDQSHCPDWVVPGGQ